MSFIIYFDKNSEFVVPVLKIEIIGYFSINGDLEYLADLSQMKYYIPPSDLDNVNYDLNRDCMFTCYKPTSHIKLDDILQWLSDNFSLLEKPLSTQQERWLDTDFVCRRGVLRALMCSPYTKFDGWIICASKYRGTIYLCEFYTDRKEHEHTNATLTDRYKSSLGYKFEQYMVADHPSHKPDLSRPLNECEEFHCMFKAKFGSHSLVYGAETDGIFSQEFIKDTIVGKTLEFIELKTYPMFNNKDNICGKVAPHKCMAWWSQNYLGGINKLICGLKDETSTVKMIKEYPTHMLPYLSRTACNVNDCKMFCKQFLDNVKEIVTKEHNECLYKFYWHPFTKNVINYTEEAPNNEKYFFLKPWFVEKAEKYKYTPQ